MGLGLAGHVIQVYSIFYILPSAEVEYCIFDDEKNWVSNRKSITLMRFFSHTFFILLHWFHYVFLFFVVIFPSRWAISHYWALAVVRCSFPHWRVKMDEKKHFLAALLSVPYFQVWPLIWHFDFGCGVLAQHYIINEINSICVHFFGVSMGVYSDCRIYASLRSFYDGSILCCDWNWRCYASCR